MAIKEGALGDAIQTARLRKGYTQDKLAEMLDISLGHLQHLESERRKPSVPMLFQLMELLDLSVDALVFPEKDAPNVICLDGLSDTEATAIKNFVYTIKRNK